MFHSANGTTPLLNAKSNVPSFKLIVHGVLLTIMTIIIAHVGRHVIQNHPTFPVDHDSSMKTMTINPDITSFLLSSPRIPTSAITGYSIINQNEFNYSNPTDYVHRKESFSDYASFEKYGISIKDSKDKINKGIFDMIHNILKWTVTSSNRNVTSFEAEWQYTSSTQIQQKVVSILESETSFYDKDFIQYLVYLLNHNITTNDTTLLSMTDTFANKYFQDIDINILKQQVSSFGAGIGFGIQIYCNDNELIFDGGAGGGGGYNLEDNPNIFQYGGGGGIQINNVSIGGGTGFQTKQYILDPNANCQKFYDDEVPFFKESFGSYTKCKTLTINSGGGSGSGFTTKYNDSYLISWLYYSVNITTQ